MITFDSENNIFYLNTDKTTYAVGILEEQILVHLYWGKKLFGKLDKSWAFKFPHHHLSAVDVNDYSTNDLPLEYSTYGGADLRISSFEIHNSDCSNVTKLCYKGFDISNGKSKLNGLPATYCENDDKVQTLTICLYDELKKITVFLIYSVFEEFDAITRNVRILNEGDKIDLNAVMSSTVDFYGMPVSDLIHLDGTWARERHITRRQIVNGNQNIESRAGASSAYHNPFIAVCDKGTTENSGNVYGFSLVYSGNFVAGVEMNSFDTARVYIGINPAGFNWKLDKGETFQTPESVLVYSPDGIGGMSRIYHKLYRERLCRGKYRDSSRFVLINNWEATYFDFNEEKLIAIAEKARQIGVDTFVLDDGWFGNRVSDNSSLGDWQENPNRLPGGLGSLAEKINGLGMHFGLWFEPEMVSPDSDLFRKHPDWIIHTKGREPSIERNQCTLDLSRQEVCEFVYESVSSVLRRANIEYVKWDMNRYMSEVGSVGQSLDRQGEVAHRYMLGLYKILERLVTEFPNVLFEGCASGGGRFDPGILHYMPQIWTSDNTDAVERIFIQYGTSIVYPYSSISAHVSACPNHQINRTTPFEMRCNVALPGQFGFELDLNKCTESEIEFARETIIKYRELRDVFQKGNLYRLRSPFDSDMSVLEFVSDEKEKIALCIYSKGIKPSAPEEFIRLDGLDTNAYYSLNNEIYGGDYLMNKGILFVNDKEYDSRILILNKVVV